MPTYSPVPRLELGQRRAGEAPAVREAPAPTFREAMDIANSKLTSVLSKAFMLPQMIVSPGMPEKILADPVGVAKGLLGGPTITEEILKETEKAYVGGSRIPRIPLGTPSDPKALATARVFQKIDQGDLEQNYLQGFTSSALSSLPEFFGMPTPMESQVFRTLNPWSGLASELIGPGAAYTAAWKISKLGKIAPALETATARSIGFFGGTTLANPVASGAIRELIRFAPLEAARLGVGLTVWPENADNLLGDVAMDVALTPVFGAAGGWIQSLGKSTLAKRAKTLVDAKIGLLPTFELRMMKDPAAVFEEGADAGKLIASKTEAVLTARPGQKQAGQPFDNVAEKPFYSLTDVGDEASALMNKFFKDVNPSRAKAELVEKNGLDIRLLTPGSPSQTNRVPKPLLKETLGVLGLGDVSDLAANVVFPRMVKPISTRMAGQIAKTLDGAGPGLQVFAEEGTVLAKDAEGLWVFMKRVGTTPPAAGKKASKAYGPLEIRAGDYWLVGKTDRVDLLLPKTHGKVAGRVEDWARMSVSYRPGQSPDIFNTWMDTALASMNPTDWRALRSASKPKAVARIMQRIRGNVSETLGVTDSKALQQLAEGFYDVFAPTARKEVRDPVYGRLWGLLKGTMQKADETYLQIMKGKPKFKGSPLSAIAKGSSVEHQPLWRDLETVDSLVASLSDEEATLIGQATQVPSGEMAGALEALSESGLIGDRATEVVRQLQEINRRTLDEFVRPALKASGVDEAKWLEGYIMPRLYRGEYYLDVRQGKKLVYRVSGKSAAETQAIADSILEAAKAKGQTYTKGPLKAFDELAEGSFDLDRLFGSMRPPEVSDRAVNEIVMDGLVRAKMARPGLAKVRSPGSFKERSDLAVAPTQWSKRDLLEAIGNHNRQLMRFAGHSAFYNRWNPEILAWGEAGNKFLQLDLQRKMTQLAGIEGNLSRAQNDATRQLFGLETGKPLRNLVANANSFMYQTMLGIMNINFALLNVVTPLMTTVPWVSFMTQAPTYRQLKYMNMLPNLTSPKGGFFSHLEPVKVMAQAMRMAGKPDAVEKAAIERAVGDGVLNAQIAETFVGGSSSEFGAGLKESFTKGGGWEFIKHLANAPAMKSEEFSRLIGFNAAYSLGRDFFGLTDEALYRFAKKGTEQSLYGYSQTDRARIMTGPMGSMLGLFKNWQFHYINQMAEYIGLGARDGVWAPALWMMGMTGAVGGLGGIPLKGAVDGFANWATEGESPNAFHYLQNNWNGKIADTVYFGLPGLLGASLQSSATMPGTDVVQDTANLANVVALQRAMEMGSAVAEMTKYQMDTGESAFANPNLRAKFLGTVLPRAAARLYAANEQESVISMRTGYPVKQGVSPTSRALYSLGFNPLELERYQVAGQYAWKDSDRQSRLIASFGQDYANAMDNGDRERQREVINAAVQLGLPVDSVVRSAMTRYQRETIGENLDRYGGDVAGDYGLKNGG